MYNEQRELGLLLIAQENLIHILLWQLRSEQAHKEHHREAP